MARVALLLNKLSQSLLLTGYTTIPGRPTLYKEPAHISDTTGLKTKTKNIDATEWECPWFTCSTEQKATLYALDMVA